MNCIYIVFQLLQPAVVSLRWQILLSSLLCTKFCTLLFYPFHLFTQSLFAFALISVFCHMDYFFSFAFKTSIHAWQCSASLYCLFPFSPWQYKINVSRVQERWLFNTLSLVCCQHSPNYSWKAAIMVPYFAQWNVSMFSQWIQGWFVWISLINCSHLNYWCRSVKPAFPMTDGLCDQVISPLGYFSLYPSIFFTFQHFCGKRIIVSCFPPLSPPMSPPRCLLPSTIHLSALLSVTELWGIISWFLFLPLFPTFVLYWLPSFSTFHLFFPPLFPPSLIFFPDISVANFSASLVKSVRSAVSFHAENGFVSAIHYRFRCLLLSKCLSFALNLLLN